MKNIPKLPDWKNEKWEIGAPSPSGASNVGCRGLLICQTDVPEKAEYIVELQNDIRKRYLDRMKALEEALKDAIESMDYALKYVEGGGLSVEDDLNRSLKLARTALNEQKCRICGCTWDNACEGGCYWVEYDLCSKCAEKMRRGEST